MHAALSEDLTTGTGLSATHFELTVRDVDGTVADWLREEDIAVTLKRNYDAGYYYICEARMPGHWQHEDFLAMSAKIQAEKSSETTSLPCTVTCTAPGTFTIELNEDDAAQRDKDNSYNEFCVLAAGTVVARRLWFYFNYGPRRQADIGNQKWSDYFRRPLKTETK